MTGDHLSAEIERAHLEKLRADAVAMTLEEAEAWLRELDSKLWEMDSSRDRCTALRETLTRDQWEVFRTLAPRFPVQAHNAQFSWGFGLTCFTFPATPGAPVEYICSVNTIHMGDKLLDKLCEEIGFKYNGSEARLYKGWELMSPISHRDQNREWLKLYDLGTLESRGSYSY